MQSAAAFVADTEYHIPGTMWEYVSVFGWGCASAVIEFTLPAVASFMMRSPGSTAPAP